ncbi:MAG: hypothetical protein KDE28_10450 [Anaerolineales bacterium]|nr:hypothetical protein [Anaerolineales bacterium]
MPQISQIRGFLALAISTVLRSQNPENLRKLVLSAAKVSAAKRTKKATGAAPGLRKEKATG